ncbi:flavodoxin domain-containing protein [Carboxylicivirga sediminis]|uniref:Flavodoxin domain-containing protein n=1 Tax=Carboxylicivirga sediminis TaxID=2006564 RepID=A0A941F3B4_9BACT|nr:flavodoxin domain-containing protein [Carboxylicivirga sediminis]MBR8536013.1 flavodoxin domain-containing protein [Carboxylicivirga sediminis]
MGFFSALIKKKDKPLNLNIKADIKCPPITILYGTKTGNAQLVAQQAHKYYHQCGIESECYNMEKYDVGRLPAEHKLLVVVSTDGEGELPPNARKFFALLQHEEMPMLPNLQYAVCALGDSSYDNFCGAGKTIEKQLQKLGAQAIMSRVDCDLDFKKPALQWIQNSYDTITGVKKEAPIAEPEITEPDFISTTLTKRQQLTKGETPQAVYHIELDNTTNKVDYAAGDCIEIIPSNPIKLVDQIIDTLNLNQSQQLISNSHTLEYALLHQFEITKLTRPVIRRYMKININESLKRLYNDKEALRDYLVSSDVLDLIKDYPCQMDADEFISILQPLHSRYYSIASGAKAKADQIDLTVKTIRFQQKEREYEGAGSTYVNESLEEGAEIHFRLVANPSFHLPDDPATPLIMIGVGTGIAPYRAFLQDLKAQGIKNKAWLIWGDKHQTTDFLYEDELIDYYKNNTLAFINTAFSRDQEQKEYVQQRLIDYQDRLLEWLDDGAMIYLCGHNKMGDQVKQTLVHIYMNAKGMSEQEARAYLREQRNNNIIREDLY